MFGSVFGIPKQWFEQKLKATSFYLDHDLSLFKWEIKHALSITHIPSHMSKMLKTSTYVIYKQTNSICK